MALKTELNREIREIIVEMGGEDIYKCLHCGKCTALCPWYEIENVEFPVYRIAQTVKLGTILSSEKKEVIAKETEEIYRCVGCATCVKQCPYGINIPNIVRAIRRILLDYGSYPDELKSVVSKLHNVGNPLGEPEEKRDNWAKEMPDLQVQTFNKEMEFLYFVCCLSAYTQRLKEVTQATAKIFKNGGLLWGISGQKEQCCCESIRKVGAEKIFQSTAKKNIETFEKIGVSKIITLSPHCYNAFKNGYIEFGKTFEIFHQTQIFWRLIKNKKIIPQIPLNKKVVYHDPCMLGKQNEIYDAPREVLKSIPGLELLEIKNFSHEYSICCGGGSGGLWLDRPVNERLADIRVKQAKDTGAEILAVACPYCMQMFEDSIKTTGISMEVKDVAELLASTL